MITMIPSVWPASTGLSSIKSHQNAFGVIRKNVVEKGVEMLAGSAEQQEDDEKFYEPIRVVLDICNPRVSSFLLLTLLLKLLLFLSLLVVPRGVAGVSHLPPCLAPLGPAHVPGLGLSLSCHPSWSPPPHSGLLCSGSSIRAAPHLPSHSATGALSSNAAGLVHLRSAPRLPPSSSSCATSPFALLLRSVGSPPLSSFLMFSVASVFLAVAFSTGLVHTTTNSLALVVTCASATFSARVDPPRSPFIPFFGTHPHALLIGACHPRLRSCWLRLMFGLHLRDRLSCILFHHVQALLWPCSISPTLVPSSLSPRRQKSSILHVGPVS